MTPDDLRNKLKSTFGKALRAVSWEQDFDFYVIPEVPTVSQTDDELVLWLWPDIGKNFILLVLDVEEDGNEWVVTTPEQKWTFHQITDDTKKLFIDSMRKSGADV